MAPFTSGTRIAVSNARQHSGRRFATPMPKAIRAIHLDIVGKITPFLTACSVTFSRSWTHDPLTRKRSRFMDALLLILEHRPLPFPERHSSMGKTHRHHHTAPERPACLEWNLSTCASRRRRLLQQLMLPFEAQPDLGATLACKLDQLTPTPLTWPVTASPTSLSEIS